MEEKIEFRRLLTPADEGWQEARAIYEHSFPLQEQRTYEDHLRALADPLFRADTFWADGVLAGIVYHWATPVGRYVEYLAVAPAMRGRGVGSEAFGAFCRRERRVVLEIEPPEDGPTVRRLRFYERLGFAASDYPYVHPSYTRAFEPYRLVLMSRPGPLCDDDARRIEHFVRERALRYSEHGQQEWPR